MSNTDTLPARAKLADWLNAFKADPFSTGETKVDRLLEIIGEAARPTTDVSTDGLTPQVQRYFEQFATERAATIEALQRSNAEKDEALREAIALLDDCEIAHPLRWEAALDDNPGDDPDWRSLLKASKSLSHSSETSNG
jgi:hypothetical protein